VYIYIKITLTFCMFSQRVKISKSEDALLVDNEYKLGRTTPILDPSAKTGASNGECHVWWCN